MSVASLTLAMQASEAPVSRRTGPRAELAFQRARLAACASSGDSEGERIAASELARSLVNRGTELETAAKLARRALLLGHDPQLREELATWFAVLGEPALAAATLRPLVADLGGGAAARVLTRIGVLLGRAGDAAAAADALFDAAREDPSDAVAPELQAAIGAWAPEAVSPERAAEGYLEGYRRREASGDRAGAFEDLLRAFEVAPAEPLPAERLAAALAQRERPAAADEVLREHARASGDRGRAVHLRRLRDALERSDLACAVAAAFDARLESDLVETHAGSNDGEVYDLFQKAGLHELCAASLELAGERAGGQERAALYCRLAELHSGPLASPERALEAWAEAVVADPDCEAARSALRSELAATGDASHWVGALLRVGGESPSSSARRGAYAELAKLAAERLDEPGLAVWAARRGLELSPDSELSALLDANETAARYQEDQIHALERQLESARSEERTSVLRQLATLLRGRPDFAAQRIAVLGELIERVPEEAGLERALERVLVRERRFEELERTLERALQRASSGERHRWRAQLSQARRRRGDLPAALQALADDGAPHAATSSLALILASRLGDERARARALADLAAPLAPSIRASLSAVVAESLLEAGDVESARLAAEQACRSDPSQARPVGALAAVALQRSPDRDVADAMERAMGFVVPRAQLCEALAVAHEALGEPALALFWTQRWLTLKPGDPHAIRTLLGRVTESDDGQRLADALSWLLSQPQPLQELVPGVCAALLRLFELEPSLGVAIARRALDVIGPRHDELRATVVAIADGASEHGLSIACLERALAVGHGDQIEQLLDLVSRRRAAGDADGAAREIARAAEAGAPAPRLLDLLSDALPARSSDGELALLQARANALARLPDGDPEAAARAFRELGAARWDLASDSEGAVDAWYRAALLDPAAGVARLARDLVSFAGSTEALRRLEMLASLQRHPADNARILALAANVALGGGDQEAALRLAIRAVDLDPRHTDVLAVAERAAGPGDLAALDAVYARLAEASLGRYGERAVHYRAARQFERRGDVERALDHAVRAFEAVPAEGVAYVMMTRLAERAVQPSRVVRALERVADGASAPHQRAAWLRRAAILGGGDDESVRLRFEVLLRALTAQPDSRLIESLGKAALDVGRLGDEHREIGQLRFERAMQVLFPTLEGPEGARMAIAASRVATDLGLDTLALDALERAIDTDADIEEYRTLADVTTALSAQQERARGLLQRVVEQSSDRYANVGRDLLELVAKLARDLGDPTATARALVAAAERDPDDEELAGRAALAAELSSDAELSGRVKAAVPTSERLAGLREMADAAERGGDLRLAAEALERVAADEAAGADERLRARVHLRELYARLGDQDKLERVLVEELGRADLHGGARARAARDLASLLAARGQHDRALEALESASRQVHSDVGLLEDLASIAARAGDARRRAGALSLLVDLVAQREKVRLLRELAPLLEQLGDEAGAMARWRQVNAIAPNDVEAIAALESAMMRQGDYEQAAALLSRRANLAAQVAEVREIRLRRAELLEKRLGRADEARAELEALLAATGDHLAVLRSLADLHERLGAPTRAAPLWLRASAATTDRDQAAELAHRACLAYLHAGDLDGARRVLDGMEAWAHTTDLLALRVDIERRGGDPRALAAALEELAAEVAGEPERYVGLLVEAAYAHDAAGDRDDALAAADRAAQLAPSGAEPQLLAAWLEYRVKGPTTREHARLVVAALRGISGALTPVQAELRAFLVAEALDLAVGTGAGMRELTKAQADFGVRPLVALGIAERLVEGGEAAQSLPLFEAALAGDLRELRSRGRVALSAVHAAREVGDLARAMWFAEIAASEEPTRKAAMAQQTQLRAEMLAVEMARERTASRREGAGAASSVTSEAATPAKSAPPVDLEPRVQAVRRTPTLPDHPIASPLSVQQALPVPRAPDEPAEPLPGPRDSDRPAPPEPPAPETIHSAAGGVTRYRSTAPPERVEALPRKPSERAAAAPVTIRSAPPPPAPELPKVDMPQSLRRISGTFAVENTREAELFRRLAEGSVEAGYELIRQLENRRSRSQDLVAVCRRVVSLKPYDREALRQLYDAALADKNHVYARSVEHVLALFDPSIEPVSPPPLADQPEDPERVRALLFRGVLGSAAEALALVWDGAAHVFRREMQSYGVTGVDRVPLGAATPLGRSYSAAARVLGMSRTPMFLQKSFGPISMSVALVVPPAVIVGGEVTRETPELMFHLGAMLTATLPEHVLLTGNSEEQARDVIRGILLAFGPPEAQKEALASAASLAEVLWERIPGRAQRRLRELCEDSASLVFESAVREAWRALRRAGLFVSGDLRAALGETFRQLGLPASSIASPPALAELIRGNSAVADLVTLASSSELAAARWQPGRGTRP